MTKSECGALMAYIRAYYPKFYAYESPEAQSAATNAWFEILAPYDFEAAKSAVKAYAAEQESAPSVADIRKRLVPKVDVDAEWQRLKDAVHKADDYRNRRQYPRLCFDENGDLYKSDGRKELKALFDSLPKASRDFVGSSEELLTIELNDYQHMRFIRIATSTEYTVQLPAEQWQIGGGNG